jgi:anti-sigma B factor antagonist
MMLAATTNDVKGQMAAMRDLGALPADTDLEAVIRDLRLDQPPIDPTTRSPMPTHKRIDVSKVGDVTVVKFVDRKILDEAGIQELGAELFSLVEHDNRRSILVSFDNVDFLSSAALGKLITLDRKVKSVQGRLKMCNIRPEILEVFQITKLNKVFDIRGEEAEAISAF